MKPSEAYLKAKHQMVEAIDFKIKTVLAKQKERKGRGEDQIYLRYLGQVEALQDLRDYVRNVMLWKNEDGK